MRLIDADKAKEAYKDPNLCNITPKTFKIIDEQPTAYDVDNIVKKLEDKALEHCINSQQFEEGGWINHAEREREIADVYNKAMEIVKGGGIDE